MKRENFIFSLVGVISTLIAVLIIPLSYFEYVISLFIFIALLIGTILDEQLKKKKKK